MKNNQNGFGALGVFAVVLVLAMVGFAAWKVIDQNKEPATTSNATNTKAVTNTSKQNEPKAKDDIKLSDTWLLRESTEASVRVPDGFNILVPDGETLDFLLADVPQGYLKYTKGETAEVVGAPHKHFELGILAGFNSSGWNDRGEEIKTMKTYSGLEVKVKEFKQTEEPNGLDFAKGTTLRQYTVIKGENSFTVDYAFMNEGIVNIVEEMVKSVNIK